MKENYLYKCTDCTSVHAIGENLGIHSYNIYCKPCQTVTFHYRLDFKIVGSLGRGCIVVCPADKDKDDTEEETQTDEH